MKIVNFAFYIWVVFIICVLSFKAFTWEHQNKKPRQPIGKEIIKTGKIFERPMDSVEYGKRYFYSWCPLVEKKSKRYGRYK